MNTVINWLSALIFTVVFFAVLYQAADGDEITERAAAMHIEMQAMDARIAKAAQALCTAEIGPGAQVLWTREGDLVCRPATLTAGASK